MPALAATGTAVIRVAATTVGNRQLMLGLQLSRIISVSISSLKALGLLGAMSASLATSAICTTALRGVLSEVGELFFPAINTSVSSCNTLISKSGEGCGL